MSFKKVLSLLDPIRTSLRNKLIFIFISVIMIPLLISIYLSYVNFAAELRNRYISDNANLLDQVNSRLDDYFRELDNITISIRMNEVLSDISQGDDIGWELHNKKMIELTNIYYQRRETNSILFYYPVNNEMCVTNSTICEFFKNSVEIENTDWYKRVTSTKEEYMIEPTHTLSGYKEDYHINGNTPVFSVNRYFKLNLNARIYGVISINYDLRNIKGICDKVLQNNTENVVFLNKTGELFYQSKSIDVNKLDFDLFHEINSRKNQQGFLEYLKGESKWLIVYAKSPANGNILCKLIPLDIVYSQASKTRNINLVISFFIIIALVVASLGISHRITRPLSRLEKSMAKAGEGDFGSFATIDTSDEIGKMSHEFNQMITKIENLINDKYKMKLTHRLSQIKALQAQINPHFLYNSLQAIGSAALDQGNKEMYKTTIALSDMLRYSIKSGGDMVTIRDEIRNVQNYLTIQKFRYGEKISYSIDIPEELYNLKIPKLVFQPIVENAIVHGIEPGKKNGLVIVTCRPNDGYLFIEVTDNGIGITEKDLMELRRELENYNEESPDEDEKIGMLNVFHRLKLMLDEKCSMSIESEVGKGTKVTICIPLG